MFCGNCGKPIENVSECPFCGAPVKGVITPAPVEAQAEAEAPVQAPEAEVKEDAEVQPAAVETAEQPAAESQPVAEAQPAPAPAPAPEAAPAPVAEAIPVEGTAPAVQATAPVAEAKPKKKNKALILVLSIVGGVILLAAIAVGAIFFVLTSKYNAAQEAFDNGDYSTALDGFTELKSFKDSEYMAEYSQIEMDYLLIDGLADAHEFDTAIEILNDRADFFGKDSEGKEAEALAAEYLIVKNAYEEKEAGLYSIASSDFDSLVVLKDKYKNEPLLCQAYVNKEAENWLGMIIPLYGIQAGDYDLDYMYSPSNEDESYLYNCNMDNSADAEKLEAIMKPADDEQKELVDYAIQGIKRDNAVALMEDYKFDEAMAIFKELGDFPRASEYYSQCEEKLKYCEDQYSAAQKHYDDGEFYKAEEAWKSIPKYKDSADKASKCEQTLPETGACKKENGSGTKLVINAPKSENILVRFYDSSNNCVIQVFVRAGGSVTLNIKPGSYTEKVAFGSKWYGEKDLFGGTGKYREFNDGKPETFSKNYKYTITYSYGPATGGNAASSIPGGADGM